MDQTRGMSPLLNRCVGQSNDKRRARAGEPSPVDVFDFQVVDDGQKVVFSLDRCVVSAAHSVRNCCPFNEISYYTLHFRPFNQYC